MNVYYKLVTNRTWDLILCPLLIDKLDNLLSQIHNYFPEQFNIFKAFNILNVDDIKVIILGQDPYHNGEADGLCFSSNKKIQPSLLNIYKEIEKDLNIQRPSNSNLEKWATQGILLLNSSLTVEQDNPLSHMKYWENITDKVIQFISDNTINKVFILWGNYAKSKIKYIDKNKHLILTGYHPSPLNGNKFFGCKHFSKCNDYLELNNIKKIDWSNT
jgi:uracil-DNA glycosylase